MQLLEAQIFFTDSQKGWDKRLQRALCVVIRIEAAMLQSLRERHPKLSCRVEILLNLLKALFSVVIDIDYFRSVYVSGFYFRGQKCRLNEFFDVSQVISMLLELGEYKSVISPQENSHHFPGELE